ncbi:MAG: transposase, partial [Cyanobacteria bacterium P01_F01_bin.13]
VEGKFGQGKRRFGLGRVMAKLAQTAETMIAITCLVMNLEKRLRRFIVLLLRVLIRLLRGSQADVSPFTDTLSDNWLKILDPGRGPTDHVWAVG